MVKLTKDDFPTGPIDDRLAQERAARKMIRNIFEAVMCDRWGLVGDLWAEARSGGEWFATAVWAGLPNTVKERLRDMDDARNH